MTQITVKMWHYGEGVWLKNRKDAANFHADIEQLMDGQAGFVVGNKNYPVHRMNWIRLYSEVWIHIFSLL